MDDNFTQKNPKCPSKGPIPKCPSQIAPYIMPVWQCPSIMPFWNALPKFENVLNQMLFHALLNLNLKWYSMEEHALPHTGTNTLKKLEGHAPPYALKYHIGVQKGTEGYQEDIGHKLEVSQNEILFYSGKWVLATWFWPFSRISDI